MEAVSLCDICGRPEKLFTCMLCGKRACIGCFILNKGICKNCLGGRTGRPPATLR